MLSSTALILLGMEFTRAAQVVAGILFHNDITELLDVRHMVLLPFRLRMPHMCSIGSGLETYLATPSPSPSAARQLSSWRCVWGGYVGKQFLKGGHHLLLQNVTVHVGIHVSLNEPQLPSTSSTHAAPDHDATTTMLDCGQGTIFVVLLTRVSPHMLDTIWAKPVYLRLIRPQDMVPVIHALGQVVFSKLFAGFFVSQLQKRLPSGTTAMQTDLLQCGVWSEHWQADFVASFFDNNGCMLSYFQRTVNLCYNKLHIDYSKIYPSLISIVLSLEKINIDCWNVRGVLTFVRHYIYLNFSALGNGLIYSFLLLFQI